MAIFKFQYATHCYSAIGVYYFHLKLTWSKVAALQVCFKVYETRVCAGESLTSFSLVLRIPYSRNSNMCFLWPGSCTDSPPLYMFWFIPQLLCVSCHSGCFGFVVCIQRRPVVVSIPSVCVSSCAVCPLCLSSLLLARSLDRK